MYDTCTPIAGMHTLVAARDVYTLVAARDVYTLVAARDVYTLVAARDVYTLVAARAAGVVTCAADCARQAPNTVGSPRGWSTDPEPFFGTVLV
jgi:hypothetical protein